MQQQWATEQGKFNKPLDQSETERQDVVMQRLREPLIAASIQEVGVVALCHLPFVVSSYSRFGVHNRLRPPTRHTSLSYRLEVHVSLDRLSGESLILWTHTSR